MTASMEAPTPYPEINTLLQEVLENAQSVLGSHFVGMYLEGSLASGDFDQDSDIDFVVVTDDDVSGDLFLALQAMHDRIAEGDSAWVIQLEGSYISRHALRRYDPARALHPNIERGRGERLKMADHDAVWDIHRYVLRERGVAIAGPDPRTLIDPVSPDDLRRAALSTLRGWAASILDAPDGIAGFRGYQSYVALTLCRILYTLHHGAVVSKPAAAKWVRESLGEPWTLLIESAWVGRHDSSMKPQPEDVDSTLALIRYTLEVGRQFEG